MCAFGTAEYQCKPSPRNRFKLQTRPCRIAVRSMRLVLRSRPPVSPAVVVPPAEGTPTAYVFDSAENVSFDA
jgi:hypothetical protein